MIEKIPEISEDFYATNGDNRVYEKINELVDAVNKLTKEEEELPKYKCHYGNDDCPKCYKSDPLSTYKAKLKERIKNDLEGDRSLVRAEVYKRVLDLIEKE